MKPYLLTALGATSLGLSVAVASVTCKPTHDLGNNNPKIPISSAEVLSEVTNACIKEFCASRRTEKVATKDCERILSTTTYHSASPSNDGDCVQGFRNIADQCITTKGVYGGTLQTHDVLYDIVVVDQYKSQEGAKRLGVRSEEEDDLLQEQRLVTRSKGHESMLKPKLATQLEVRTPKTPKPPKKQKTPKTSKKQKTQKTPKTTKTTKTQKTPKTPKAPKKQKTQKTPKNKNTQKDIWDERLLERHRKGGKGNGKKQQTRRHQGAEGEI